MEFFLERPRRSRYEGPSHYPDDPLERPYARLDYVPEHNDILASHYLSPRERVQHSRELPSQPKVSGCNVS